jgi:hypothetical protein
MPSFMHYIFLTPTYSLATVWLRSGYGLATVWLRSGYRQPLLFSACLPYVYRMSTVCLLPVKNLSVTLKQINFGEGILYIDTTYSITKTSTYSLLRWFTSQPNERTKLFPAMFSHCPLY